MIKLCYGFPVNFLNKNLDTFFFFKRLFHSLRAQFYFTILLFHCFYLLDFFMWYLWTAAKKHYIPVKLISKIRSRLGGLSYISWSLAYALMDFQIGLLVHHSWACIPLGFIGRAHTETRPGYLVWFLQNPAQYLCIALKLLCIPLKLQLIQQLIANELNEKEYGKWNWF